MSPGRFILISLVTLMIAGPGVIFAMSADKKRSVAESLFPGLLLGMVVFIYIARLLPLSWSPLIIGLEYAACVALLFTRNPNESPDAAKRPPYGWEDAKLLLVSIAALYIWWMACSSGLIPSGPDAPHNVLLAAKTIVEGSVPTDWLPFETITVRTATGGAFWNAVISWITRIPPHDVYETVYPHLAFLIAGFICLIGRALGRSNAGYIGALFWTATARWGGLEILNWGHAPYMMALTLIVGMAYVIVTEKGAARWILTGLFLAGVILTSHIAALIAVVFMAVLAFALGSSDEEASTARRDLATALLLGVALTPLTLIKLAMALSPSVAQFTTVLEYREYFIPIENFPIVLGYDVVLLGLCGLYLAIRSPKSEKDLVAPSMVATVFVLVAVFGYAWRMVAFGMKGEFYAALAPSKLLMAMTPFLCLGAGVFVSTKDEKKTWRIAFVAAVYLVFIVQNIGLDKTAIVNFWLHKKWLIALGLILVAAVISAVAVADGKAGKIATGALIAALLTCGLANAIKLKGDLGRSMKLGQLEDFNRVKAATPRDALVINRASLPQDKDAYAWLPYWLWSECTTTPLPSTEEKLNPRIVYKRTWLEPGMHEAIVWAHMSSRPVVFIYPAFSELKTAGASEIYRSGTMRAYLYDPSNLK